jgi:glycosyltransferase involved in cell wall biosynthesis
MARQTLGWPTDRLILFSPRRLVHRVGLEELLKAIVLVKQQIPDVWLAIAGKGPQRETLDRQVQEWGLQDHVRLVGYLADDQLPLAYQAADLTVVPSQSLEGFGLILLESLACGTPPVCTPIGGMPEVIAPFNPNLVTATAEAGGIADRLIELLQRPTVTLPDRTACREYACHQFDWQKIATQVRTVLLKSSH